MRMTLTRTIAGSGPEALGTFEGSLAHDDQFLIPDPRCRLQLRRLLPSDLPAGLDLGGATALLWVKGPRREPATKYTVRMDPEAVVNSRAGVLQAIACVARYDAALSASLMCMALSQTVWGVAEDVGRDTAAPATTCAPRPVDRTAKPTADKQSRRGRRRKRR